MLEVLEKDNLCTINCPLCSFPLMLLWDMLTMFSSMCNAQFLQMRKSKSIRNEKCMLEISHGTVTIASLKPMFYFHLIIKRKRCKVQTCVNMTQIPHFIPVNQNKVGEHISWKIVDPTNGSLKGLVMLFHSEYFSVLPANEESMCAPTMTVPSIVTVHHCTTESHSV